MYINTAAYRKDIWREKKDGKIVRATNCETNTVVDSQHWLQRARTLGSVGTAEENSDTRPRDCVEQPQGRERDRVEKLCAKGKKIYMYMYYRDRFTFTHCVHEFKTCYKFKIHMYNMYNWEYTVSVQCHVHTQTQYKYIPHMLKRRDYT